MKEKVARERKMCPWEGRGRALRALPAPARLASLSLSLPLCLSVSHFLCLHIRLWPLLPISFHCPLSLTWPQTSSPQVFPPLVPLVLCPPCPGPCSPLLSPRSPSLPQPGSLAGVLVPPWHPSLKPPKLLPLLPSLYPSTHPSVSPPGLFWNLPLFLTFPPLP